MEGFTKAYIIGMFVYTGLGLIAMIAIWATTYRNKW